MKKCNIFSEIVCRHYNKNFEGNCGNGYIKPEHCHHRKLMNRLDKAYKEDTKSLFNCSDLYNQWQKEFYD